MNDRMHRATTVNACRAYSLARRKSLAERPGAIGDRLSLAEGDDMRSARFALVVMTAAALTLAGVLSAQQPKPAKPMQIEKVKDGLYVIRGPFNFCAPNGCGGAYGDDGLLHEAGDVAVRVTPEGLILVDDKFQNNV